MRRLTISILFMMVIFGGQSQNYQNILAQVGDADKYPDSPLVVIFDSTSVEMQPSGLSYYQMHTFTKVLTTQGAKNLHVVKLGYDPLSAYVEIQKVIIYKKKWHGETDKESGLGLSCSGTCYLLGCSRKNGRGWKIRAG